MIRYKLGDFGLGSVFVQSSNQWDRDLKYIAPEDLSFKCSGTLYIIS